MVKVASRGSRSIRTARRPHIGASGWECKVGVRKMMIFRNFPAYFVECRIVKIRCKSLRNLNVYFARACGGGGALSDDDVDSDDDDEFNFAPADDACDDAYM